MGVIQKICCKNCKSEWECCLGSGRNHLQLSSVAECFDEDIKQALLDYENHCGYGSVFSFSYEMGICESCKSIVSVPVLFWNQPTQKVIGSCPNCAQRVTVWSNEQKKQQICPNCNEKTQFEVKQVGLWD